MPQLAQPSTARRAAPARRTSRSMPVRRAVEGAAGALLVLVAVLAGFDAGPLAASLVLGAILVGLAATERALTAAVRRLADAGVAFMLAAGAFGYAATGHGAEALFMALVALALVAVPRLLERSA